MPAPTTASTTGPVWLHCSPARTVWRRRADDGSEVVEKVYVSGSMLDAERECRLGRLAAGPGVATYLEARTDPSTRRPSVLLRYEPGENLDALVAKHGALPAVRALTLLLPVARALSRLHALRCDELPQGMCHGDLKPQNILSTGVSTLLLDFEHAAPVGTASGSGTTAFAPPEAAAGRPLDASADVFGLGATLGWLLRGGTTDDVPQHPDVSALVGDACAPAPEARPTAAAFAARAEALAERLADDGNERCLEDWTTGAFAAPPAEAVQMDPRVAPWHRRKRLAARRPELLKRPAGMPTELHGILDELDRIVRTLRRFPRHKGALRRRLELLHAAGALLVTAPAEVREFVRTEQFAAARRWLHDAAALARAALATPGGLCAVTHADPEAGPGAFQRTPIEFLGQLAERVDADQDELVGRTARIDDAERALDLVQIEQEIEALAADYGGTSPTVARRRDRAHRLAFYLDRIARAQPNVERVAPLWDPITLQPLQQLVAAATTAGASPGRRDGGAVGLRSLQLTLTNVCEEFPHLDRVPVALDALSQALGHLTDQAWQQLADAEQQLRTVPVPVRPLQLALGRLDTFRMLEAFVDRAGGARSELLDGIERLRMGIEQARATRDRLAENAEHALARGHWTTGLFEMERAVAGLHAADDQEHAVAERLKERLQAARRTKQEIESAVRRNVELTAAYANLEDEPGSTFAARLQVLEERRDCLLFLGMHAPSDRAVLYRKDLRAVETSIAVEQAALAEQRLDATTDPVARLRLAHETLDRLSSTSTSPEAAHELPGRLVRLREHWRTLATQCRAAVDAQQREYDLLRRQRRRIVAIAIVAVIATGSALAFALRPWITPAPAEAGERAPGEAR